MSPEYLDLFYKGTLDTLYMTSMALVMSYLVGLPLGIALVATEKGHILESPALNQVLSIIVNIGRSIPFIILAVAIIPVTRFIVGQAIGTTGSIVPLVVAAIPFVGRLVEASLKEVDRGIVEAALAMGASPRQIIFKVLIPEVKPSLVLGATITFITLIGYSAMMGAFGGGGLGDIAVRYGYYRYETGVMAATVILLIILVQLIQSLGNYISRKLNKK